jgi:DNA-binding transcriptional ArsR family regulator
MVRYSTLDRTFSALSDPTRRQILERLARGPATISELRQPFDISLPGLLKHVGILQEADLGDAAQWIQTYQSQWERRLDRLEGYLEKRKGAPR